MDGRCADCRVDGRLHARGRCRPCYWIAKREAEKETCPGCGERARLRPVASGPRCWRCRRNEAPRKQPTPRRCRRCGEVRRHGGHGLCRRCIQREPASVGVWVQGARGRLGAECPDWFGGFAEHLLARCAPAVCLRHLRRVERALRAGHRRPVALLAAVSDRGRSGRSPGATARLLESFLIERRLALAGDERGRLAQARRARRLGRCPQPLRPALERYLSSLLEGRERARRTGQRPLTDHTIEQRLAVLAELAARLERHAIHDWASVSREHIEWFLAARRDPGFRLAALRNFFRFARKARICLTDPTLGLGHRPARGFRGRTLTTPEQTRLLKRWIGDACHPHEALIGLLCLLHGASAAELRGLQVADIDQRAETLRLGRRPHRVPLDPLSARALERCLSHRRDQRTNNPHLFVTRGTRAHRTSASPAYLSHVLDPADVSPRLLRQTRLCDLSHRLDARLVADAFGITAEAALHYLTGTVDSETTAFANL